MKISFISILVSALFFSLISCNSNSTNVAKVGSPTLTEGNTAKEIKVQIKEWDLPTPNSMPHDPAVGLDGALWYTGMTANVLGRLDPNSGDIREYQLPQGSGPHGLAVDKQGTVWYTANTKGVIGKLDPKTEKITEYPMPDEKADDPHTPVFDRNGILWFTVQNGNFVGRLDPQTGAITLKQPPTHNSHPYGIAINSKGVPFFCEFNSNKIGRIDPNTLEITEYSLPHGARPRRLAITPDDLIYYSDYARGYLGRLSTDAGIIEEWKSPGGSDSAPYGIATTPDGMVWYCESEVTPNNIVRFDPRTHSLRSWPIPSGGGVVRNIAATQDGKLYLACSGVNKVAVVSVQSE